MSTSCMTADSKKTINVAAPFGIPFRTHGKYCNGERLNKKISPEEEHNNMNGKRDV